MNENLIIILVVAVIGLLAVTLGVKTSKRIWGRITWWNIIPAIVLGIVLAASGNNKRVVPNKAKSTRNQNMAHDPVKINKIGGSIQFYWDGTYVRASNGQALFEFRNNSFRKAGGPEMYRVSGDAILATNGAKILVTSNGRIQRFGGPVEYDFDGRRIKPVAGQWAWESSQPVPAIIMLVCAGILKTT
jgi:hypothetical protein